MILMFSLADPSLEDASLVDVSLVDVCLGHVSLVDVTVRAIETLDVAHRRHNAQTHARSQQTISRNILPRKGGKEKEKRMNISVFVTTRIVSYQNIHIYHTIYKHIPPSIYPCMHA